MSSNKKSDNKNDKAEQEALKEAEIVAELAPDEKTRKEAEKLVETVEIESTSEIFDTYRQAVLKFTEHLSKFQPKYAESISNLQQEYLELTKEFMNKLFAAQRNWVGNNVTSTNTTFPTWIYTPYEEQFRRQSNEITTQALSVFDNSNQLALNALTAAKENLKLYRRAMESITEYNNNAANAWASFLTAAQRQQYFRQ
jgi:hypothetical protein